MRDSGKAGFSRLRRRLLQAGAGAGGLALAGAPGFAWGQSSGVLSLPRIALVVGNNKYQESPLKNPANDAAAIAQVLRDTGFEVTTRLDVGRAALSAAVQEYVQALSRRKCVGLFYFAGHGLQLAWRNYLLPVDADIDSVADVASQSVDLGDLLSGIGRASNPLNVVILDACRNNPFGNLKGLDQKGLSQMDAPVSTLLAYATAPGNVASDGDGANGLYTENLVRELKVPEAKIEDVFKRVRLGVRRKSNGAQVPWESTSLEEDFYFLPPKELKRLSDAEAAKRFEEELALWEKIKGSTQVAPLEDYLKRYPSGNFSELALLQFDRVLARQGEKKVQLVSDAANPYSKGSAVANTQRRVGDSYTARIIDLFTKLASVRTETIVEISDTEVKFSSGRVTDLLGNPSRFPDGRMFSGNQFLPLDFSVGKRWSSRFRLSRAGGFSDVESQMDFRISARETIAVPAGRFDTFRIEAEGISYLQQNPTYLSITSWVAPDKVRYPIAREERRTTGGRTDLYQRTELVAFSQS
jgi:uncharacterized caspase-like protein